MRWLFGAALLAMSSVALAQQGEPVIPPPVAPAPVVPAPVVPDPVVPPPPDTTKKDEPVVPPPIAPAPTMPPPNPAPTMPPPNPAPTMPPPNPAPGERVIKLTPVAPEPKTYEPPATEGARTIEARPKAEGAASSAQQATPAPPDAKSTDNAQPRQAREGPKTDNPQEVKPAANAAEKTEGQAPPATTEAVPKEDPDFVKGDLSSVGADRLTTKNDRVGVSVGYNRIGNVHYALVYPQLDLRFMDDQLRLGLGVPLNIELFNTNYPPDPQTFEDNHVIGVKNAGTLRKQDWDQYSEFARALIYFTYGHKEDHLYVNVGQRYATTIGHGAHMRRYAANTDVNVTRVGAELDAYNDWAGFEAMTNDVFRWSIVSLLGFVKPLAIAGATSLPLRSLSVGATVTADREAPLSLNYEPEPSCLVPGACAPARVPLISEDNRLVATTGLLTLAGVTVETKIVKTDNVDVKPYFDVSKVLRTGGGTGYSGGVLTRLNFGMGPLRQAFRFLAEARWLGQGYRPSYFDTFYEVDKYLFLGTGGVKSGAGLTPLTKLQATVGDPAGKYDHPACAAGFCANEDRAGYYLEASYGVRDAIGLTLALSGEGNTDAKDAIAHVEVPFFSFLQVFASVYKRGFTDFGKVTELDASTIGYAGARLKLLPILFVNARAFKTFELDAYRGKYGPLGTLQYQNVTGYAGDVEVGWEF